MKTKIYLSSHHNPWFNLAIEDYLFHHDSLDALADTQILFLWQNAPSIIIGRAQNPYLECQLKKMEEDGVLLARRQSGGGTVYHDLGNLNFTFISPSDHYSKENNFNIIIKALEKFNLPAIRSPRNDLLVSYDGEDRKISGSAFRETKKRAFHHGTLLINADLDRLKNYLIPSEKKLEIKGVHSIRSNVINLNDLYLKNLKNTQTLENTESPSALSPEAVTEAIMASFLTHYTEDQSLEASKPEHLNLDSLASIPSLKSCHEQYQSWDWRFGRTLPFTHRLEKEFSFGSLSLCLTIENALIQNCEGDGNINLDPLKKALMQVKYDAGAIQQALKNLTHYPEDFKQWLISEI